MVKLKWCWKLASLWLTETSVFVTVFIALQYKHGQGSTKDTVTTEEQRENGKNEESSKPRSKEGSPGRSQVCLFKLQGWYHILVAFLCQHIDKLGAYTFWPVCLSIRLSFYLIHLFVRRNFNIGHSFWMISHRAFIFHIIYIFLGVKSFLSYQSQGYLSKSDIKVTVFKKKKSGHCGDISVSPTQLVLSYLIPKKALILDVCSTGLLKTLHGKKNRNCSLQAILLLFP